MKIKKTACAKVLVVSGQSWSITLLLFFFLWEIRNYQCDILLISCTNNNNKTAGRCLACLLNSLFIASGSIFRNFVMLWGNFWSFEKLWEIWRGFEKLWEIWRGFEKIWEIFSSFEKLWEALGNSGKLRETPGNSGKLRRTPNHLRDSWWKTK